MEPTPVAITPRQARNEAFLAWLAASVALVIAVLASRVVPFVNQNLGFIAAVIFIMVPGYFLRRRGEFEADYGLGFEHTGRALRWGIGATVITFAVFMPAFHLWETRVEGRVSHFDLGNYRHPGSGFYGAPAQIDDGKVPVWTWDRQVMVAWRPERGPFTLTVTADGGRLADNPVDFAAGQGQRRIVREGTTPRLVRIAIQSTGASGLTVHAEAGGVPLKATRFVAGAEAKPWVDNGEVPRIPLGFGWLVAMVLTQIILVAIPEEFFFRGYVQERLAQAWGRRHISVLGLPLSWPIVVASVLFALVHLFATPDLTRLAVFFPGLVFGALRVRTKGIGASVIYHAACNLMVILLAVHYF